jgi:hypothetical protein
MYLVQKSKQNFLRTKAFVLIFLFFHSSLFSESLRLSLEDAVRNVLENNLTVKNAKMEIAKSDSATIKNTSKFVWKAFADITVFQNVLPINNTTLIAGNRISQDKIAAGFEKQYETGTYVNLEASSTRFDSNAFEGSIGLLFPAFSSLALKPLYTGAFTVKISQEL